MAAEIREMVMDQRCNRNGSASARIGKSPNTW